MPVARVHGVVLQFVHAVGGFSGQCSLCLRSCKSSTVLVSPGPTQKTLGPKPKAAMFPTEMGNPCPVKIEALTAKATAFPEIPDNPKTLNKCVASTTRCAAAMRFCNDPLLRHRKTDLLWCGTQGDPLCLGFRV